MDLKPALLDELEKISAKKRTRPGWAALAGGALAGLGIGAAAFLARKKGIRTQMLAELKGIGRKGGARGVAGRQPLHPAAIANADAVAKELLRRGVDPSKARIAIGGTGGTGKSTFAKALSERLGMGLGPSSGRRTPIGIQKGTLSVKPGTVSEQTQMLQIVDPSKFDVVIKMEKPYKQIREQILKRGRGAGQIDYYNYPRLQKIIDKAFKTTSGTSFSPTRGIQVKVAPSGGFDTKALAREVRRAPGVGSRHTREEQIMSLVAGKPIKPGSGRSHIVKFHKLEPASYVGGGILAGTGAGAAWQHQYGGKKGGAAR